MVLTRAQTRSAQPNSLPIVNRPSSKIGQTFRVRGVPRGWNRDELHAFLVGKVSASTTVCSLANEVHERSQTATVSFQDNLSQLEELLTGPIWNIPLPSSSNQSTGTSSLKLDDDFLGITTLYAPPSQDHKIDIIAISGLGGHAFGSFKERHGEHMWLRDALPYHITGDDNKKPNSRIMIYGYNSNLQHSNSFQNLEDLGTAFHSNLRNLTNTGAFRPIVFVAHSLGGLIVKQTLISLSRSDDEQDQKLLRAVYGIAFFGVPHHGMNIQSLISIVGNGPNRFLLESIGPHSSQILSIYQREFPRALGGQGECKIICFYETRLSPTAKQDRRGKWNMTGPDAVLVSKSSATHCRPWENGPEHICAIDRNHSEMVKFGSEDSEYEKVIGRIQSLVREAQEKCLTQKHPLQPNLSHQAQECLKSLAFGEMDNRAMEIEPAISGTCEWLLQHETYKNWAASNSGLLWVKGKPGSGKSTLLKYAFSSQKDLPNARDSDLVLSFFFHGRGSELQKTPFGFFRSLLHQTLGQAPNLLSDLVDTFEKKCKEIGEYYEKWQWHPEQLWSFFESSLPRILATRSIWLFVDALDECGESNAKGLVRKLKLLLEKTTSSSIYSNALRICFSCRHYPILSSPGLAEVCLEWENRADILTYVQSELSSLEGIQDLIIDRASGVFLWAQLVVKRVQDLELDGAGPNEIQAAVNSIPKNLESLFNELIRNMRPASLKLIQWIHFSTRPLSIKELRWAMSIDANCSSIHACQNAMGYIPDDERMRKRIVSLSQGLAEIAPGSRTQIVQFIHQSVKDFFIDKGLLALNSRFMSTNEAIGLSHLYLSETCIRYLAMEEVGQLTSYQRDQMSADFPFLQYATTSCVTHMKQSDDHNTPAKQFLELFAWPSNDLVSLWTKVYREIDEHSGDCPSENTSLVHIAASYGIQGVMNAILQSLGQITVGVDSKDKYGRTPLSLAAEEGHEAIVKLLLATGQVEVDSKDEDGWTPLLWASIYGHEGIVKLLLATGQVEVDLKDEYGRTPLSLAAEEGHEAIVKLLLATGQIEINSKEKYGRTPLSWAVGGGHEGIVKLLLATGQVEIDLKDEYGQTPLLWASIYGHEGIVKLLLATGQVEIDSKGEYGQTLLSQAAEEGHEAVVKLLLATGQVEIDSKDEYGRTPLSVAAKRGHEAVVKLLLATGQVEINSMDKSGQTPLSWAAEMGYEAVVKLLLATGQVEINSKDDYGHTPLSWAVENGYENIVNLLKEYALSHLISPSHRGN